MTLLGRREQAIARYRKVIAAGRDGEYLSAARKYLRHPYTFTWKIRASSAKQEQGQWPEPCPCSLASAN